MKLIDPFFKKLRPQIDHLSHEVIMAQAWKKTHAYMRTHNWYADTLGLDISALGLEHNVKDWAEQVKASATFLHPMELVPAAKSEEWRCGARM